MDNLSKYLPTCINSGTFLTAYTLNALQQRINKETIVLPICSLGTSSSDLKTLAPLVLPPLYHEAMDPALKREVLSRIQWCFPFCEGTSQRADFRGNFEIVELPPNQPPANGNAEIVAFSVDTAVEEHGPHLPLMTDTLQSYAVLTQLARSFPQLSLAPPVEYGHLTWGLPFGLSIDLTAPLLTRYVTGFTNAILRWLQPRALYVVDVHGSVVHRNAIKDGLQKSDCNHFTFRWLHEPLVEYAAKRGDQHAGGVETALIGLINDKLIDPRWWPAQLVELAEKQMTLETALELSDNLPRFFQYVEAHHSNGIVGDIMNFSRVDANLMMQKMIQTASKDVLALL